MADSVISVTPTAIIGGDLIENVFYYLAPTGLDTAVSPTALAIYGNSWITNIMGNWLAALPALAAMVSVTVRTWENDGSTSEVLPVILLATGAGTQSGARDGNIHCATIAFNLDALVALDTDTASLRASHVNIGPLLSAAVADDGSFISSAWGGTVAADLLLALDDALEGPGADSAPAVRVSKVKARVAVPDITGYRAVLGCFYRLATGTARSRTNGR